eukprot:3271864-Alexandrium_andersonii.AAC.2
MGRSIGLLPASNVVAGRLRGKLKSRRAEPLDRRVEDGERSGMGAVHDEVTVHRHTTLARRLQQESDGPSH